MVDLAEMLLVRNPALRARRVLNTARTLNFEAYISQLVREVSENDSTYCARGASPWALCVFVDGYLTGTCMDCPPL